MVVCQVFFFFFLTKKGKDLNDSEGVFVVFGEKEVGFYPKQTGA